MRARAYAAMNDDFNTPILMAVLYDAVKVVNSVSSGRMALDGAGVEPSPHSLPTSPRTSSGYSTRAMPEAETTAPTA